MSSNSDSAQEKLWEGLQTELEKFGRFSASAQPSAPEKSAVRGSKPPAFAHVRVPPAELNPVLAAGIEFAQLDAAQKFDDLHPGQFPGIPEIEVNSIVAVSDPLAYMNLRQGENLVSKTIKGRECFLARGRGKVVLIGKTLHILLTDRDGRAFIRIASDNMRAHLSLWPGCGNGSIPDFGLVTGLLKKSGIIHGILEPAIQNALLESRAGNQPSADILIAEGDPPVHGEAAKIEYFFERDLSGPVNLSAGPDGKIDFRNVTWVPIVAKDCLLAKITPGIPFKDGRNVIGEMVPARRPQPVYLIPGQKIRCENEETEFYSEINGCVQLNGRRLDVMNVYMVNSDVDYHTGNVHFDGNVLITGTVCKGFEVEAEGDVVVLKNVEPSRVKAGRDVIVKGGVLGSGKSDHRVEAGRHIAAGYSENAWLEAQSDIRVENYALQSFLYSCGSVLMDQKGKGSILGGETMALKGVCVKSLGSPAGIRTQVAAGVNFPVKRKLAEAARQKSNHVAAMEKIDTYLKSLMGMVNQNTLPPSKKEALRGILDKRNQMIKAFASLLARIFELKELLHEKHPVCIRVSDTIYPEVLLDVLGKPLKITASLYRSEFYLDLKTEQVSRRNI